MASKKGGQGIAHWPETERPRERLLTQGPQTLTNAQLLAILLRVGRLTGSSAVQVGMDILDRLGDVAGLRNAGSMNSALSQGGGSQSGPTEGGP